MTNSSTPSASGLLTCNGIHKKVKLPFEDFKCVLQDLLIVGFTQCNEVHLLLHSTTYGWQNKLCICKTQCPKYPKLNCDK